MAEETPLGYPYPENSDLVDVAGDIQALAEAIDEAPGVPRLSQAQIDALGTAGNREGRVVHNTTTGVLQHRADGSWHDVVETGTSQVLANKTLSGEDNSITDLPPTAVAGTAVVAADLAAHASDTTSVHGIVNTADLATKAYADQTQANAVTLAAIDATSKADDALTAANSYTDTEVAGAVTQMTAYADAAAAAVVDSAPATLNTLNELAAALGDDPNYATSISTALGGKASTASLTAHTSATTSVHGIADTADLVVSTDSRLSDARTPVAHKASHSVGGADALAPGDIGAAVEGHSHDYSPSAHTHPYADDVHSHDYADSAHTHAYADSVHTHDYAESSHAHPYSLDTHTHDFAETSHTHPYSPSGHVHDYASSGHVHSYADVAHTHDYAESSHTHSGYVASSLVDAAGDLLVGTGSDSLGRLPHGLDGQVLSVDVAGVGVGVLRWIDPPAGSGGGGASLGNGLPAPLGVAAAGVASTASRSDHVHSSPFGGVEVAVGGSAPLSSAGYLWVDTSVEV